MTSIAVLAFHGSRDEGSERSHLTHEVFCGTEAAYQYEGPGQWVYVGYQPVYHRGRWGCLSKTPRRSPGHAYSNKQSPYRPAKLNVSLTRSRGVYRWCSSKKFYPNDVIFNKRPTGTGSSATFWELL